MLDPLLDALGRPHAGLVRRDVLLAHGATPRQLRAALARSAVHEVAPGVLSREPLPDRRHHLVVDDQPDPAYVLQVRAALLSAGPRVAARGRTTAALLGLPLLVEPDAVELVAPHGRVVRQRSGVDVVVTRRFPTCVGLQRDGAAPLRVTALLDTVACLARERSTADAVVVLDALLRSGRVSARDLARSVETGALADRRGRLVAARCDERAESLLESVARVRLLEAGLTGFVLQHPVVDHLSGRSWRADFAWPAPRLVVEVDGARFHGEPGRDRRRDNAFHVLGWRVLRYGWDDVVSGRFVDEVAACLGRAGALPRGA